MQAIETRYLGPTPRRGAKVKAITESGISLVAAYADEFSGSDAHWPAAKALAEKLGWHGEWIACAVNSCKRGFVFVRTAYADGRAVESKRA